VNRLECPECGRISYCASLTGPLHCSHDECGALILPGGDVDLPTDRRSVPRIDVDTEITIEYLVEDKRIVEKNRPFVDASIVSISTVLEQYSAIGSRVVLEFSNADDGGVTWRVSGLVREVQPAEGEGFRVGIEIILAPSAKEQEDEEEE